MRTETEEAAQAVLEEAEAAAAPTKVNADQEEGCSRESMSSVRPPLAGIERDRQIAPTSRSRHPPCIAFIISIWKAVNASSGVAIVPSETLPAIELAAAPRASRIPPII